MKTEKVIKKLIDRVTVVCVKLNSENKNRGITAKLQQFRSDQYRSHLTALKRLFKQLDVEQNAERTYASLKIVLIALEKFPEPATKDDIDQAIQYAHNHVKQLKERGDTFLIKAIEPRVEEQKRKPRQEITEYEINELIDAICNNNPININVVINNAVQKWADRGPISYVTSRVREVARNHPMVVSGRKEYKKTKDIDEREVLDFIKKYEGERQTDVIKHVAEKFDLSMSTARKFVLQAKEQGVEFKKRGAGRRPKRRSENIVRLIEEFKNNFEQIESKEQRKQAIAWFVEQAQKFGVKENTAKTVGYQITKEMMG